MWENRRRLAQQCCWGAACHSWATFQCVRRSCLAFPSWHRFVGHFHLVRRSHFIFSLLANETITRFFLRCPFFISLSRKTSSQRPTKSARPRGAECFPWEKLQPKMILLFYVIFPKKQTPLCSLLLLPMTKFRPNWKRCSPWSKQVGGDHGQNSKQLCSCQWIIMNCFWGRAETLSAHNATEHLLV